MKISLVFHLKKEYPEITDEVIEEMHGIIKKINDSAGDDSSALSILVTDCSIKTRVHMNKYNSQVMKIVTASCAGLNGADLTFPEEILKNFRHMLRVYLK